MQPVTPPTGYQVNVTAGSDRPVLIMPVPMPGAQVNHPLQQQPLQQSTQTAGS